LSSLPAPIMAQKGVQPNVWSAISALDAFPKVNEDFFKKTMSGGVSCCLSLYPAAPKLLF
jgi:hypothetical protein